MPDFRCYFLNANGRIAGGFDLLAANLEDAKLQGRALLEERRAEFRGELIGIEIWQATSCLYSDE